MSEDRPQYLTDALEMISNQPATVIEPPRQIFERKPSGEFEEVSSPAWIKFSTAFKPELKKIDGNALKIWVFIALSVNYKGEAFPAIQTIAGAVDLSHTTVIAHLRELEKLGLLAVRRGEKRHNIYEISDDYVKVGRGEPVKNLESSFHTIPENDPTSKVLPPNESSPLESNKKNKKNQNMPTPRIDRTDAEQAELDERKMVAMVSAAQEGGKKQNPLIAFEGVFAFGKLPWDTNSTWEKFAKFVRQVHEADPTAFGRYISWRGGDGKYSAFSNRKIRENPQAFMDTGWPEFVASEKPKSNFEKSEITYDKHGLPESW